MSLPIIRRNPTSSESPTKKAELRQKPVVIPSLRTKVQEISKEHANIKLIHSFLNNKSTIKLSPLKHQTARRIHTQMEAQNGHFLDPSKILVVSSTKWTIFDAFSEKYIRGFKNDQRHQLNKFSKLLVFYCVYAIAQKYVLDISKFECIVTTKAELKAGIKGLLNRDELVTLQSLLYIMTFEESYESEYVIAVNIGAYLSKKHKNESFSVFDIQRKDEKTHLETFGMFMNTTAKVIGLQQTKINSLVEEDRELNVTCADDVAKLSLQCMKIPMFNKIVAMKSFTVKAKCVNEDGELEKRQFVAENLFENTKYLPYKYICKNDSRNFALSSCAALFEEQNLRIVVIMLNSHSNIQREKDVQKAIEWYLKKLKSRPLF